MNLKIMFLKLLQYLPETKELGHPDDESMFFLPETLQELINGLNKNFYKQPNFAIRPLGAWAMTCQTFRFYRVSGKNIRTCKCVVTD